MSYVRQASHHVKHISFKQASNFSEFCTTPSRHAGRYNHAYVATTQTLFTTWTVMKFTQEFILEMRKRKLFRLNFPRVFINKSFCFVPVPPLRTNSI